MLPLMLLLHVHILFGARILEVPILLTSPKHCVNKKKREHCKEHHVQVSRIAIILAEKAAEPSNILQNVLLLHL